MAQKKPACWSLELIAKLTLVSKTGKFHLVCVHFCCIYVFDVCVCVCVCLHTPTLNRVSKAERQTLKKGKTLPSCIVLARLSHILLHGSFCKAPLSSWLPVSIEEQGFAESLQL